MEVHAGGALDSVGYSIQTAVAHRGDHLALAVQFQRDRGGNAVYLCKVGFHHVQRLCAVEVGILEDVQHLGQRKVVTSVGNGRLDAVANAIQSATGMEFHLENYSEHSLDEGSTSRAASYVGLTWGDGTVTWGAGTDTDIIVAGVKALVSAINNK